jgi:hypothetical protein
MESKLATLIRVGLCAGDLKAALDFFRSGFKTIDLGNTSLKRYYLYDDSNTPYFILAGKLVRGPENNTFLFSVASPDYAKCEEVLRDFYRETWLRLGEISHPVQAKPRFEIVKLIENCFERARKNYDLRGVLAA